MISRHPYGAGGTAPESDQGGTVAGDALNIGGPAPRIKGNCA